MKPIKIISPVVVAIFVLTRLLILFAYSEYMSDVTLYFEVAEKALSQKLMVYKEVFYGYPPLSLISFYLPYYFSSDYHVFRFLYQLTNLACDFITLFYLAKILGEVFKVPEKRKAQALILYCILGLFHGHYMYDRVDMVIVMCFVCAMYYAMLNKSFRAIGFGVLGVLWKIIPIIWLPVILLLKLWRKGFKGFAIGVLAATLPIAGYMLLAESWYEGHLFKALSLHSDRGIQIESLFATPIMIFKLLQPSYPAFIELIHGAHHLAGEGIVPWYLNLSKIFGSVVLALFFIWVLWGILRKWPAQKTLANTNFARIVFVLFSTPITLFLISQRVLSTTFTIWLIPITCLWWATTEDDRHRRQILALALSISVLTYIGFDIGYFEYRNFSTLYGVVYLIRNILLIAYALMFFSWGYRAIFRLQFLSSAQNISK